MLRAAIALAVVLAPIQSHAGGCYYRQRAYAVPVIYQPFILYQAGSALREEAIATRAALLATAPLQAELAALRQEIAASRLQFRGQAVLQFQGEAAAEGTAGAGASVPPPTPAPAPTDPGQGDGDLAQPVAAIVQAHCLKCHNANKAEGKLDLSDLSTLTREQRLLAWSLCFSAEMPKGGQPLSDADVDAIRKWASAR